MDFLQTTSVSKPLCKVLLGADRVGWVGVGGGGVRGGSSGRMID